MSNAIESRCLNALDSIWSAILIYWSRILDIEYHTNISIYIYIYPPKKNTGNFNDTDIWMFPKMVGFPNKPMGFPNKKWSTIGVWNGGYHHLRKHPYLHLLPRSRCCLNSLHEPSGGPGGQWMPVERSVEKIRVRHDKEFHYIYYIYINVYPYFSESKKIVNLDSGSDWVSVWRCKGLCNAYHLLHIFYYHISSYHIYSA